MAAICKALGLTAASSFKSGVKGLGSLMGLLASSIIVVIALIDSVGYRYTVVFAESVYIYAMTVAWVTLVMVLVHPVRSDGTDATVPDAAAAPNVTVKVKSYGSFYYKPNNANPELSVLKIDGVDLSSCDRPQTHAVTMLGAKESNTTPRMRMSQSLLNRIGPTKIRPESGDVQRLVWDNGREAWVFFAHSKSEDEALLAMYQNYKENKDSWEESIRRAPNADWCDDDLGGGEYLPLGYGCYSPGPKNMRPSRWQSCQIPYIKKTILSREAPSLTCAAAGMSGTAARVIKKYCPEAYQEGVERGQGADDVIFPPKRRQEEASSSGAFLFSNQCIFRTIGEGSPRPMSLNDSQIALHFDMSDEPAKQALQFFPMGGSDGFGGPVRGTDLLIYGTQFGGACAQVPTAVHDCVVMICMDGCTQLHGGTCDGDDIQLITRRCSLNWTIRYIPYIRGDIMRFVEKRRDKFDGNGPPAFIDLKRDGEHWPLRAEEIEDGRSVAVYFSKNGKKRMYEATVDMHEDGYKEFDLVWTEGNKRSPNWTSSVYDVFCANGTCNCKRNMDFRKLLQ